MDSRRINLIQRDSMIPVDVYYNAKRIYVQSTVNLMRKKVVKFDRATDVTGYKTANKISSIH